MLRDARVSFHQNAAVWIWPPLLFVVGLRCCVSRYPVCTAVLLVHYCLCHSPVECVCECWWNCSACKTSPRREDLCESESLQCAAFPPIIHLESVSHLSPPSVSSLSVERMQPSSLPLAMGIILYSLDKCNNPNCLLWNIVVVMLFIILVQSICKRKLHQNTRSSQQNMLHFTTQHCQCCAGVLQVTVVWLISLYLKSL